MATHPSVAPPTQLCKKIAEPGAVAPARIGFMLNWMTAKYGDATVSVHNASDQDANAGVTPTVDAESTWQLAGLVVSSRQGRAEGRCECDLLRDNEPEATR